MEQYSTQPQNCYNMDEKGFLISHLQKVRRIFPKALLQQQRLLDTGQDGSREWITLIAIICADKSSLPPALIYKVISGDLRDSWLQDITYRSMLVGPQAQLIDRQVTSLA
jgi:hypothetical protein